jgi:hypothetical protein
VNKTNLKIAIIAFAAIAIAYRVPQVKSVLTGDDGSWF